MEFPKSRFCCIGIHGPLGKSVYEKNTSHKCDIQWYAMKERCTTILCNAIENGRHKQCDKRAAHNGKVGCNTVKSTTAFPYSDWPYFL